jgi:xanthine dehydrogenase YagR molybdenum-binding subunit
VKQAGVYDLKKAKNAAVEPRARTSRSRKRRLRAWLRRTRPVKLDATYTTPDQSHAMMEPHASIAMWEGEKLTCTRRTR